MENPSWLLFLWGVVKVTLGVLTLLWLIWVTTRVLSRDFRIFAERQLRMERRLNDAREDARPPFLLLRSFFDNDTQSLYHLDTSIWAFFLDLWRVEDRPSVDFVSQLSRASTTFGPLVAIGGKELEEPGLSKHRNVVFVDSSDRDWESLFLVIAKASRAIFVLPARSKGLLKEVSLICRLGLTGKTIVLMPGAGCLEGTSREALGVCEDKWVHIRLHWMSEGLQLPSYVAEGMLYIPNGDFSIKHSCLLDAGPRSIIWTLPLILPKLDGTYRSTYDLLLEINK